MESYEFELWAQLPEDEAAGLEAEELYDVADIELSDDEVLKVVDLLIACGLETSEAAVEEKMKPLHDMLRHKAEMLTRRGLAMRLYKKHKFSVDEDDLMEEDQRSGNYKYVRPADMEGDDEDEYADALYDWQQWERDRMEEMDDEACAEYLKTRYGIEPTMEDADYGYRLPDELAAEAMAKDFR